MEEVVVRQLVELNSVFYESLAEPFSESRTGFQPGFKRIFDYIPRDFESVLDIGCGNGRLAKFLRGQGLRAAHTGVDFSHTLLTAAAEWFDHVFVRDLSRPDCLDGLGNFDLIASLATLQHIPGRANRVRLLREMAAHLPSDGRIVLSNWQFLDSPRQRRKIRPWPVAGIDPAQIEPDDYLLTWSRGGSGVRYVAYLDAETTRGMAGEAGLMVKHQFYSDGREGNLNLYTILAC